MVPFLRKRPGHGNVALVPSFILIGLIVTAPTAAAGGELDAAVVTFTVEDARRNCAQPIAGWCLLDMESDGTLGNTRVDTTQAMDRVSLAADLSLFSGLLGDAWTVPDQGFSLDASGGELPNPLVPLVTESWQDVPQETPISDQYWLEMTSKGITIHYRSPISSAPEQWTLAYAEENGIGYDHLGPFAGPFSSDSDNYLFGWGVFCDNLELAEDSCRYLHETLFGSYDAVAPTMGFGASLRRIDVATSG